MKNIVTFSTNQGYVKYAKRLVKSIKDKSDCLVVCRCVNCDNHSIDILDYLGAHVLIDDVKLSKKLRPKNVLDSPFLSQDKFIRNQLCNDETTYTCHSRFENIKYCFDQYDPCTVFCIDVDFMAINDFDGVFDMSEDISMMDKIECVHEDAICIKSSTSSKKFISDISTKMKENPLFWDQDTEALKFAFEMNPLISFKEMDISYKDYTLSDESKMWSGDGLAKFNPKFKLKGM